MANTVEDRAATGAPGSHGRAEAVVRTILRAPSRPSVSADRRAYGLFSASVLLSGGRCLLTYLLLPIVLPLTGSSVTSNAALGLTLSAVAFVFDVRAVRRFWLADHRWRWQMTGVYVLVLALVIALAVNDLAGL